MSRKASGSSGYVEFSSGLCLYEIFGTRSSVHSSGCIYGFIVIRGSKTDFVKILLIYPSSRMLFEKGVGVSLI